MGCTDGQERKRLGWTEYVNSVRGVADVQNRRELLQVLEGTNTLEHSWRTKTEVSTLYRSIHAYTTNRCRRSPDEYNKEKQRHLHAG